MFYIVAPGQDKAVSSDLLHKKLLTLHQYVSNSMRNVTLVNLNDVKNLIISLLTLIK